VTIKIMGGGNQALTAKTLINDAIPDATVVIASDAPEDRKFLIALKDGGPLYATGRFREPDPGDKWITIGDVTVAADSVEYVRPA
jgi:hypothetical protein